MIPGVYVQVKLKFQAVLDQVFPEYHGVFGDLYSKVSLRFLSLYPTSKAVLEMSDNDIAAAIHRLTGRGKSISWAMERTEILVAAAKRNPFKETAFPSHLVSMEMLIKLLLQYQEHLAALEQSVEALAEELIDYELIQSIPGIGP